MKVQLVTNSQETVLHEVEVSDLDTPQVIIWQHRAFVASFSYGSAPLQYVQQSTLEVD